MLNKIKHIAITLKCLKNSCTSCRQHGRVYNILDQWTSN